MVYPAFPVVGSIPGFLNPFDPSFQLGFGRGIDAIISPAAALPVPPAAGGAVVVEGAGNFAINQNPELAIFGWSFIRIVPAAFSGTSPIVAWPQRIGPRFAYFASDPGGVGFNT